MYSSARLRKGRSLLCCLVFCCNSHTTGLCFQCFDKTLTKKIHSGHLLLRHPKPEAPCSRLTLMSPHHPPPPPPPCQRPKADDVENIDRVHCLGPLTRDATVAGAGSATATTGTMPPPLTFTGRSSSHGRSRCSTPPTPNLGTPLLS